MQNQIVETYRFRNFIENMDKNTPSFNYSKTYSDRSDFCSESWEEAVRTAKYGMKQQGEIEKIISSMCLLEKVKTKGYNLQEHGLSIDIGTYLSGEPECWIAEEFSYKPKRVVKLLINIGCPFYYDKTQIFNRGAGIISLIQMLKKQGYIVKVNIYESCLFNDKQYTCFIKIPSNPLDLQSLTYAICNSSMLRRFCFAWLEQKTGKSHCHGYGIPAEVEEVAISKDIIHFNGLSKEDCEYENEKETKNHILKLFTEFLELNNDKSIIQTVI